MTNQLNKPVVDGGDELEAIIDFLLGKTMLDGMWYGEQVSGKPTFWWRKKLGAAQVALKDREQEAERRGADKARFELMYRVLLSTEGYLFIPKGALEEPLTTYELTTYENPVPDQPGVVYRLSQPDEGKES